MLRVSSGFQTLENNKTTRPEASWFQMFQSRVWKPDETLALVFEILRQMHHVGVINLRMLDGKTDSCTHVVSLSFATGETDCSQDRRRGWFAIIFSPEVKK